MKVYTEYNFTYKTTSGKIKSEIHNSPSKENEFIEFAKELVGDRFIDVHVRKTNLDIHGKPLEPKESAWKNPMKTINNFINTMKKKHAKKKISTICGKLREIVSYLENRTNLHMKGGAAIIQAVIADIEESPEVYAPLAISVEAGIRRIINEVMSVKEETTKTFAENKEHFKHLFDYCEFVAQNTTHNVEREDKYARVLFKDLKELFKTEEDEVIEADIEYEKGPFNPS